MRGLPSARRAVERTAAVPRRAIVLGAGGVLGFAWMVGALSTLEVEAELDAREVDLLIGTSAGSVAASLLACGVSVSEIRRQHQGVPAPDDPPIGFTYPARTRALPPRPRIGLGSPRLLLDAIRHPGRTSPMVTLSGVLPTGRGTLAPVREMITGLAASAGFAHRWPDRPRPWIVATDYHAGRRVVFGRDDVGPFGASDVALPDAVVASCSIPAWYPPLTIGTRPYIDGGTVSSASVDLLRGELMDEVYVLAPMASVEIDRPRSPASRLERAIRRLVTRGIMADVEVLRSEGVRVVLVTPGPEDLAVIGSNLMNPRRRGQVLQTAMRSAAGQLRRQLAPQRPAAGSRSGGSLA